MRIPKLRRKRMRNGKSYGFVVVGGKSHHLGHVYGSPECKRAYEAFIRQWLSQTEQPTPETGIAIGQLTTRFYKWAMTHYVDANGEPTTTLGLYKRVVDLLNATYMYDDANAFGPRRLKSFRESLVARGWSRGYINASINRVRSIFRWGVSEEYVRPEVLEALRSVAQLAPGKATEHPAVAPVPDDVVQATIEHLPQTVADMVRFQRLTGCRPQQVRMIRPCEIDTSGEVWLYVPENHKTKHRGKRLVICIGPQAQMVLKPYLVRLPESYCFSPRESEQKRRDALHAERTTPESCGNRRGEVSRHFRDYYTKSAYRNAVKRAAENAGVEHWFPNQLRHNAATMFRANAGIEVASAALGHSNVNTTEIYAEKDLQSAIELAKAVG